MRRLTFLAIVLGLSMALDAAQATPEPPMPNDDSPLVMSFAALLNGRRADALKRLEAARTGADGAAADMILASLMAEDGSATGKAAARKILAARAALPDHSATMSLPWTCDHRKGTRSALFDLAVLDDMPDEALIARAMQDGDGRAALWVAESLAARRVDWKGSRRALTMAWKANIVEAYYPEAIIQTAAAGTVHPVDVAGSFFLFAITFAADQRAFDAVMAGPPKIPERLFREIKAHIETERHQGLTDAQFRNLLTEAFAKVKGKRDSRPRWEQRFCAVRELGW